MKQYRCSCKGVTATLIVHSNGSKREIKKDAERNFKKMYPDLEKYSVSVERL